MEQTSVRPVVQRLNEWRTDAIERLRAGEQTALALKLALDAAIVWLEVCERRQLPSPRDADVVVLPFPEGHEPLGDYRIMWDAETEERGHWQEAARASPGDLLVRIR
jgi:hypothetical protein